MSEVKKIEWSEFVEKCKSTCKPSCEGFDYLIPGLKSEIGEVYGVLAKYVRGDFDEETFVKRMKSEVGDVMWFVAIISDVVCDDIEYVSETYDKIDEIVLEQVNVCINEVSDANGTTSHVLALYKLSGSLGFSLYDSMIGVLDKLKKRKEKGTIQGDGESNEERLSNSTDK